ncbi:diacylglycerol/lipid kinase family protein [Anaerocolumna xylanovorans]|uniref:Lipid kinase, YegS/Rv2252/BmrU family n=1 Tax=Anaerocolumna xylanovorans DSM 12503 TaxID=1121345 RepID=A0A1M7Y5M1_9FIRM|nr:diacylglycerol kinase family protein [Anaerocolumna xylanovorans]SHO47820.1 lipid kinase, YegS/Rv2252/BmrU family [Anaerocolumna xylanovorans DSM 12503]
MYYFIINPHSCTGKGLKIWHKVQKELDRRSVEYKSYLTTHAGHGSELAKHIFYENEGILKLIIVGGDGTVNEVVNGIPEVERIHIGYIPAGSSNDLGRSLRLSKDPIENLNRILNSTHIHLMDVGLAASPDKKLYNRFLVSSGLGYDASVCKEALRTPLKTFLNHIKLGKLTYILIALKQLFARPFMEGMISADGSTFKSYRKLLLVTSMIQKYEGGGMKMAPGADPNDGKLSICFVHGLSKLRVLAILPFLLIGKHTGFQGVETFDCQELTVKLVAPQVIHLDGECPGDFSVVTFTCLQNKVQLLQ